MILIRGGDVVGPDGVARADVLVDGPLIKRVREATYGQVDRVIEATGCLVGPGLVDMHTHLREPGQTWKEDIESGSMAGAAGGFTAVVAMPNTDPPIDDPKVATEVMRRGEEVGKVDVRVAGALTEARGGLTPSAIEQLYEVGVRMFTDDGDPVADSAVLEQVMRTMTRLPGAFVAQHCEGPGQEEIEMVGRDLRLVAATGSPYHCLHVSSADAVGLVASAKEEGLPVTAEVTPHHLSFTAADVNEDPDFKMYPPLRQELDRVALRDAVRGGVIDCVATDHAPHLPEEKEGSFEAAPPGVIGLETAASVTWSVLGDPVSLFDRLSVAPARILGLATHGVWPAPGTPANLMVFDTRARWSPRGFASRSSNSPYLGRELEGRVVATIFGGRVTYEVGRP